MTHFALKRLTAWLLTFALLATLLLTGVVLPVSAAGENLFSVYGDLDDNSIDYSQSIFTTPISAGAERVLDPDGSGNYVLKYTGGSTYLSLSSAYVQRGVTYKFTCRMKGDPDVASGKEAGTRRQNKHTTGANEDTSEYGLVELTSEWQTLTRYFTMGGTSSSTNYNYVMAIQSKSAYAYFDDFTLTVWTGEEEPEPEPEPEPTTDELLGAQGTFDSSEIDYTAGVFATILNNGGSLTNDPTDGSNTVLKFTDSTTRYLKLGGYAVEGVAYVFTCRVKGDKGVSGITAGLRTNEATTTNGDSVGKKMITVTDEWQTLTRYFIAGSNKNYIVGVNAPDGAVYYDDFTLTPLYASGVKVPETMLLGLNSSAALEVTIQPDAAAYTSISFASDNENILTVDNTGLCTAKNVEGTANVTVTLVSKNGTFTAQCAVNVVKTADAMSISHDTLHLAVPAGSKKMIKTLWVTAEPSTAYPGALTWTSSEPTVASVDANGLVTALAEGTAVITVTSSLGYTDSCTVTVDEFGEKLIGGDFESTDYLCELWQKNILSLTAGDGKGVVEPEAGNETNHVLRIPAGSTSTRYLFGTSLQHNKAYTISFRAKGEKVDAYIPEKYVAFGDNGNLSRKLSTTEWTRVSFTCTVAADELNNNYMFGFSNVGDVDLYIDDFSIVALPKATAMIVAPTYVELFPGRTQQLLVTPVPAAASVGPITWESSDDSVVTVSSNGLLTAVGESGTAIITATNADGLTCTVNVLVSEYANLIVNGNFELGSTGWASGDAGQIKAGIGKDGTTGIDMASNGASKRNYYYKNALPLYPATRYILTFDYKTTGNGSFRVWSDTIGCSVTPPQKTEGEWRSFSHIFTTPADMTLTKGYDLVLVADAGADGDVYLDNICLRMYSTGIAAESIEMQKPTLLMAAGYSTAMPLIATPADSDLNRTVWVSDNPAVAKVTNGKITAVSRGTATITATTANGKTASCVVTVVKPTSLSLDQSGMTLSVGEDATITPTAFLNSELTTDLRWISSNTSVVKVENGKVTAVAVGTATVTARLTDRISAVCAVTVLPADQSEAVFSPVAVQPVQGGTLSVDTTSAQYGSVVTVTVSADAGYQLVAGSLKYITADGSEHRILNKADSGFGAGNGTRFAFTMPLGAVSVTAEFVSAAEQNFNMNTVGTSLYYEAGAAEPTGIRFLTRLYIENLNIQDDKVTLTYKGKTYTVREFGTLMKRSLNATALKIENYDESDTKSATRLWKAVAYDGSTMKLVDYTDAYLDFTVVMKTSRASEAFNERYYDARAYLVLDDGSEEGLVLYGDTFTDNADSAKERYNFMGSKGREDVTDIAINGPVDELSIDPVNQTVREFLTISNDSKKAAEFWCGGSKLGNDTFNSVTLQWEEDGSDTYRVIWSTDYTFTENVKTVLTDKCEYTLILLVPGNTYYWKVRNARGVESDVRALIVEDGPRWIDAEGGRNIRDIGGWMTESGKTVNYELLYRGAMLDGYNDGPTLTEEGKRIFVEELGIKTEIDLRGSDDGEQGQQSESDFGAVYVKVPINQFDQIYTSASSKQRIGTIMKVLADENNYPIYFHCNAGADRTGTIAFLINGLLGVSYEDLTRDFEMTSFGNGTRYRGKLDSVTQTFSENGIMTTSGNYVAWGPLYETMMSDYGTEGGTLSAAIENFLKKECGVTDEEIASIRRILLG